MSISILYDLSRLMTRVLNATPNGIDRIDHLLAGHFLNHRDFETFALGLGFNGPRVLHEKTTLGAAGRVAAAWQESASEASQPSQTYETIVARLCAPLPPSGAPRRLVQPRPKRVFHVTKALLRYGPARGSAPRAAVPRDSIYINAAHFPLEWKRHVAWLDDRPDVRPVFWIHDLLPIERPDLFWRHEPARHAQRLDLLARRGAAAAVASACVEDSLRRHLDRAGRRNLPVFRSAPPAAAIFAERGKRDDRLTQIPFFLACGTIEPRKNHLTLLRVWRDLVKKHGPDAPKLVVVGKRGWNSADIVSALEDESLRGHVIEAAGLPTPDYKRLLDHCRALLAPSLAEGFGLPMAEALLAGTPVIASDIPPFREQRGPNVVYLDPLSDAEWNRAILGLAGPRVPTQAAGGALARGDVSRHQSAYLDAFDGFLRNL
ncbi:MAG: glycosyltransferase [Beijerinckiaceae bacterium]|nr:glycosyltransferase [Beijerinckiaceae bacterium]